jgi:putative serine protease PepD
MPTIARPADDRVIEIGPKHARTMKITVVVVAAAAVAGGLIGAVIALALDGTASSPAAAPAFADTTVSNVATAAHGVGLTPEQIYRRDAPAVVVITSTETQEVPATFFTPAMKERVASLGSGFVVDRTGDILTNDHVVQGGTGIRVGFSSGASYPAKIVGADPTTDVAVVRVRAPSSALHPLAYDDSDAVAAGDRVYAIGNPFGLDRTMTAGIVSATGRDIEAPDGLIIPNAIQTDAPINHGNSGGPLLDRFGRVVGISAQIEGGTVDGNIGIGFAIPSDTARSVAGQLIADGHASHAWLGAEVETIDPALAGIVRGLPDQGVTIARVVKGSPAAKAGLERATHEVTVDGIGAPVGGDVIVAADGRSVATSEQLAGIIANRKPGDRLTLTVVRDGRRRTVSVTLGNYPSRTS